MIASLKSALLIAPLFSALTCTAGAQDEPVQIGGHRYVKLETRDATRDRMLDLLAPAAGRWSAWKVLSPFPYAGHGKDDLATALPPEASLARMKQNGPGPDLTATFTGKNGVHVSWKDLPSDPGQKVDLRVHEDDELNEQAVCYAYATVECTSDSAPVIPLGSDDGIRIWVNGKVVHSKDVPRGLNPTEDRVRFPFVAGKNHVLMKIAQGGGGWEFQVNTRPRLAPELDAALYYYLDRDFPPSREREHYRVITYPVPDDKVVLEIGGITFLRDGRPVVATRRGDVFIVNNAYRDPPFDVTYTSFATGLHEALGLGTSPDDGDGAVYAVQRSELTRLVDENGDDHADLYQTYSDAWNVSGNYHEFAFGPEFDAEGNAWVTLNVGFCGSLGKAAVEYRGACLKIAKDGSAQFVCDGLRSPNGIGTFEGAFFYVDNQGDYVATNKLAHLKQDSWHGHPASLRWRDGMTSIDDRPPRQEPAVWFPYGRMGQSVADIERDATGGAFGPFAGQLFCGDQLAATIMRVSLEQVEGHYQGACYPFLSGLACGVNRLKFAPDGSLIVGETDRGWGSVGRKRQGLERVVYLDNVPFEILAMTVTEDGFQLTFTQDLDPRTAADTASYKIRSFTYEYHAAYGAAEEGHAAHAISRASMLGPRTVRLTVDPLRRGYVHELVAAGIRSADGAELLHDQAWYTLTNIPGQPPHEALGSSGIPRVLFLTHSAGFEHGVVKRPRPHILSPAEEKLVEMAKGRFLVDATQDCGAINAENLARYDAVVFYTTGELPISEENREALFGWIRAGGGFVGVHAATDTWYTEPRYIDLIGGTFDGHPWHQDVTIDVEDQTHSATRHLGPSFALKDEIYQHKNFARHPLNVLMRLDPESVDIAKGNRADQDYANAWWKNYGEGRVFYTALGHRPEVWNDPRFQQHLLGGIESTLSGHDHAPPPPAGATVLFAGSGLVAGAGADAFQHDDGSAPRWRAVDDGLEINPGTGDLFSKEEFSDFTLHLEFMIPASPDDVTGQARGNSGLYILGRYELQVLDSYGVDPGPNDCGAIYNKKAPDVNASRPPAQWQTYDVRFWAPRFGADGAKTSNARISAWLNGIRIHDDVEIDGPTGAAGRKGEAAQGPIQLQDHGNTVRYRNIWIVPKSDRGT